MTERSEIGGGTKTNEKQLFVAVRSMDRRFLVSPSKDTPDFFDFTLEPEHLPLESRAAGLMRTHHGIVVADGHTLASPQDEPNIVGQMSYQRYVTDFEKSRQHGLFDVHAMRDTRHTLLEMARDPENFPEIEQRIFRIKAELFQQVINLFEGKSISSPRR